MIKYNDVYNDKIKEICLSNPTSYSNIFRSKKGKNLLSYILECTSKILPSDTKLSKRICFVLNEFQDLPKCKNPSCDNKVIGSKQIRFNEKWTAHCCNKCAQSDPDIVSKVKSTKMERYGNQNYNGDFEKIKQNNLKKYGTEWFFQSKEGKEKIKGVWKNKGYDHPMHSEEVKEKIKNTCLRKYGYSMSLMNPEVLKKARLKYFYDDLYFGSSWELAYYIYLKDNNIEFAFQPREYLEYVDRNNIKHYYFPDFKVGKRFVEIKGNQFISKNGKYINPYDLNGDRNHIYESKHQCMIRHNVKVLSLEEIKPYIKYCESKFKNKNWKDNFRTIIHNVKKLEIEYNVGNLIKEFEYYRNMEANIPLVSSSKNYIIRYFQQDVFYAHEKKLWENEKIRARLLENRSKQLSKKIEQLTSSEILAGFKKSGIFYGYSHFNPLWFKWFIQKYNVKSCYDPCGGWGHRLLGSLDLQRYIYNDLSENTYRNVCRMVEFFNLKHVISYNEDARTFVPKEMFDSMFTCPPYFNVEEYECGKFRDMDDYNDFIDSLFRIFKSKRSCRVFGLVTREDLIGNHTDYSEKYEVKTTNRSYLSRSNKHFREFMFVFKK